MAEVPYVIDEETLRDRPVDEDVARRRVAELEALGEAGDDERVPLLRMLGRLEEAEELGWKALERRGGPGDTMALAMSGVIPFDSVPAAIRLAHVLHWREQYGPAGELYSAVLRTIENARMEDDHPKVSELEAFAHQHLGKLRFDESKVDIAKYHFEHALEIREAIGAPADQIESSRKALDRTVELRRA